MPIAALPKDTTRAITSSLVLNDAVSVVKELIDNALDARANSISIEISSNTLETIQVKDNGTGIGVEDRQLLCKRGCTSKIRTIEDLASIGGTFLGFRGEALASVAELSGSVTITTRIEGEVVGSSLKYGGEGRLLSSSSASHPVGTTVRIQDFLSRIPVRKQTALKLNAKTLNNIRKLLYGYAFARPDTRLTLKVLKSKDGKANWSHAPSQPSASLSECASKIVGKDVSAQCQEHNRASEHKEGSTESAWTIKALLLDAGSGMSKASGADQHFSVDGRPVNAERGTTRELSKLYKQYLRSACGRVNGQTCPSKPFLYVRITCPSESYDVNVEPAKNDLLFYKPTSLHTLFAELLTAAYGNVEPASETASAGRKRQQAGRPDAGSYDLLMAHKPALDPSPLGENGSVDEDNSILDHDSSGGAIEGPFMACNMYAGDVKDMRPPAASSCAIDEEPVPLKDLSANNPWAIAKMNVVLSPKRTPSDSERIEKSDKATASFSSNMGFPNQSKSSLPKNSHRTPLGHNGQLPSPVTSPSELGVPYQNPGPPSQVLRRRGPRMVEGDEESVASSATIPAAPRTSLLDTWVQQSHDASQEALTERQTRGDVMQPPSKAMSSGQSPVRHGLLSLPYDGGIGVKQQRASVQQQRLNHSFRAPFKTPLKQNIQNQSTTLGIEAGDELINGFHSPQVTSAPARRSMLPLSPIPLSSTQRDLEDILDFERQKRAAIAQQRRQAAQNTREQPLIIPTVTAPTTDLPPCATKDKDAMQTRSEDLDVREAFDERFGSDGLTLAPISSAMPNTNNPHRNRYLAAMRNLDQERYIRGSTSAEAAAHGSENVDQSPKIPDSDPRGYLIHHICVREKQNQADSSGTRNAGLRIKRTKTMRLPLESIPPSEATYGMTSILIAPEVAALRVQALDLNKIDEYHAAGEIRVVRCCPEASIVELWQRSLQALLRNRNDHISVRSDGAGDDVAKQATLSLDLKQTLEKRVADWDSRS